MFQLEETECYSQKEQSVKLEGTKCFIKRNEHPSLKEKNRFLVSSMQTPLQAIKKAIQEDSMNGFYQSQKDCVYRLIQYNSKVSTV